MDLREQIKGVERLLTGRLVLVVAAALFLAAIAGIFLKYICTINILDELGAFALVVTLSAVLVYMYDTHRIAEWTCAPTASLHLYQPDRRNAPLLVHSLPANLSRVPLALWCRLHILLDGIVVDYGGFYSEKQAWFLQPGARPHGIVNLQRVIDLSGRTFDELKAETSRSGDEPNKDLLVLTVEYRYESLNKGFQSGSFCEGYYFDFRTGALVLDVDPRHQQVGRCSHRAPDKRQR